MRVPASVIAEVVGAAACARVRLFKAKQLEAERRGLSFNLFEDQFFDLVQRDCLYCGVPPSNVTRIEDSGTVFEVRYSGIDRVDNARGYEPDNVAPCCGPCNLAKGNRPAADLLARARRIAGRWP